MKRLFGLIGLTYLSVLAVVYYLYSKLTITLIFLGSFVLAVLWLVLFILKRKNNLRRTLATVSATALCACLVIILYSDYYYIPISDKYSSKEVNLTGYICDEVIKTEEYAKYTIQTETVNGANEKLKIQLTSYTDLNISEFEGVNIHCTMYKAGSASLLSDGIFFRTYVDDSFRIEQTGEKHFSLYSFAVTARKAMKSSLESLLKSDYSSMCSAVLLGDKLSLPQSIRSSFSKTGSSYLIVVSGMHMAVIASVSLFLIKKLTKSKILHFITAFLFVFAFMAVTGFTPSVVRSGIMIIISYSAAIFLRTSDAVNSLGVAALILLVPNPYAVGDVGLILSFSATLGIILWSGKMYNFIISKLELKSNLFKVLIKLATASLSASIWVVPISTIYFGRVSPLVLFVSLLVSFAVEGLIVCSLFASIFYMIPFIQFLAYPFALFCGMLSKYIIFVVGLFSEIPFSSVNSDKPYFYICIAVSIALVILGYMIKDKAKYAACAVSLSFLTLVSGSIVHLMLTYDDVSATVYSVGDGMAVAIKNNDNVSVLSCGGSAGKTEEFIEDISYDYCTVDFTIIPNQKYRYSRYQFELVNEFDCLNVLVYDNESTDFEMLSDYDGQTRQSFGNDVQFTAYLSDNATDTVLSIDNVVYQFIRTKSCTMLVVPSGADISKLPEEYRNADITVIDSLPKNTDLLNSKKLIYSNTANSYKESYNSLKEICINVISTAESDIIIDLKDGVICQR